MRTGPSRTLARLLALPLALGALLAVCASAHATSGGGFTTINSSPPALGGDGGGTGADEGLCHNGNGNVNCNQYYSKNFVWMNGGPDKNGLSDGLYFFAVLVPGTQHDPNDGTPPTLGDGNLSDDFDAYTNREFVVKNGEIASYAGTHRSGVDVNDNDEFKINLAPYSDTTNPGGVYILSMCQLASFDKNDQLGTPVYPVKNPSTCKEDAFKIGADHTPPTCPPPTFSFNADKMGQATQVFSDPGGIDSIQIDDIVNLNVSPLKPGVNWFQGTTSQVSLTATEVVRAAGSRIRIFVTDVGGNTSQCDPVITTLRVRAHVARAGSHRSRAQTYRVSRREDTVRIRNGHRGLRQVTAIVNGKRFVARHLRSGERRKLHIRSALHRGSHNKVRLVGRGRTGAHATIIVSN